MNLGDHARPARDPLKPGRPTQPVQCSGSSARRIGSSTTFGPPGSMLERISASASASSSVPRSAPQCTIAGSCPAEISSTSETPSDRRAITQLARPTMVVAPSAESDIEPLPYSGTDKLVGEFPRNLTPASISLRNPSVRGKSVIAAWGEVTAGLVARISPGDGAATGFIRRSTFAQLNRRRLALVLRGGHVSGLRLS